MRSPTITCLFNSLLGLFLHGILGLLVSCFGLSHKLRNVLFWAPLQLCWRALFGLRSAATTCLFISLFGGKFQFQFPTFKYLCNVIYLCNNNNQTNYSNFWLVRMLIEARCEMGRVLGALVFQKAPSSLVPKLQTEFFSNEGSVPLIYLGESN